MTPGRRSSGRSQGRKTAAKKKAAQRPARGSRNGSARSKGGRAAHEAASTKKVARASRRRKASTQAATSASTSRRAPAERPQLVFEALTAILAPYMTLFEADMHPSLGYSLKARGEGADEIPFAGVQWSGERLSFRLFLLQRHPDLREQIGPDLRARQEDDWSFGFERVEPELFVQLTELTARAYERLQSEGLAPPLRAA